MTVFLLAVVALVLALIWFGQRRMIYFPIGGVPTLATSGLGGAEDVVLTTEDGLRLRAWFVPASPARGTIVVFNGNAGHRGFRAPLAEAFAARGWSVLLTDYRGFGGNPGAPTEEGLARDARAALTWLRSRSDVDAEATVYFGESLGAAVATRLAIQHPPRALVLRSPFTSLADVGRTHYPFLPVGLLLRDRYPVAELVPRVGVPVVVVAGTADVVVPYAQSVRVYDAARDPKRLIALAGADHNDSSLTYGADMVARISEALETLR
jgi:fermentation-respiration switch protein FrsA (DUF1100 family)